MNINTGRQTQNKLSAGTRSTRSTLRIAYLPFYVDYYEGICPDFPREKTANANRCAKALASYGEVLWDGELIVDIEQAVKSGRKMAKQKPDCVVVFTTIAVFGAIPWAALQQLKIPILIWNAQQIRSIGKGYSMEEIVRNTGQIGTQALANTLLREGRWFRIVTGYEKSKRTAADLARFFNVIRTVKVVRHARLLAIGEAFPMMSDILIDEKQLQRHMGITVQHIDVQELTTRYQSVRRAKLEHNNVMGLTADEAKRSARLCTAVQRIVEEVDADAGSLNCHGEVCLQNPAIGITACYSLGVQNAQGRPFTCTGDLPTAIAMLIMKHLSGMAMYTEVQVMDEKRRAIVIANSGEGEDGIRKKRSRSQVRGNTNFVGLHGHGASFAYPLQPGPATLVSFTPSPKNKHPFHLIVAEGEILQEPLPDAGALAGFFRFGDPDFHTAYTRWMEAGAVHHAATALGHWASELKNVAELLELEFVEV